MIGNGDLSIPLFLVPDKNVVWWIQNNLLHQMLLLLSYSRYSVVDNMTGNEEVPIFSSFPRNSYKCTYCIVDSNENKLLLSSPDANQRLKIIMDELS